jgi:Tol biopolymer transport system component
MAIGPGTRIGLYEIVALIGAGGMGEVYRANDTRLQRQVAIKFLSATLADAEARRRFQREAQVASSLNHPHILTVYDAGELDDRQYLVTELIDGGTLSDWASASPRSYHDVADLLSGVADGLAAAHDAGIVHRDIKPANVLVARNGYATLVDFGLAKLQGQQADDHSPTVTDVNTRVGVVIGTVPYMSPEQAAGTRLDSRSDVFSFGVMLYELVAGHRPFEGRTDLHVLELIQHGEPVALPAAVPPELRALIGKALAKDPDHRYQSMHDLASDLKRVRQTTPRDAVRPVAAASPRRRRALLVGIVAGIIVGAAVVAWRLWQLDYFWSNPLDGVVVQRLTDFAGDEIDAAISPDGNFTAFLSDRDGGFDAWISPTGSGRFINVTKGRFSDLYRGPIRWVGFSDDNSQLWFLEQVSARPQRFRAWLTPVVPGEHRRFLETGMNPAWSPDRTRLVYHTPDDGDPIFIADRNGNNPRQIYVDRPGVHNHFLTWSPDGRFIYFVKGVVTTDETDVWRFAVPADGARAVPERITHHNSRVAYLAWLDPRTLIYSATADDGASQWLYAMDVRHRIPHRVTSGIAEQYLSVAATTDARRLLVTVAMPLASLWSVPLSGQMQPESSVQSFAAPNARALSPRFGPDYVLMLSSKGGADGLWKMSGDAAQELWRGSDGGLVAPPAISPDGTRIAFAYRTKGRSVLSLMSANGTDVRVLTDAFDIRGSFSWSADGQWIVFAGTSATESTRIYKTPASGGSVTRLTDTLSSRPLWSPDGTFIVYSQPGQGARMQAKAMTPDGKPYPFPELWVNYQTGSPYRFVPGAQVLIYLKEGDLRHQNFFRVDLSTGEERQISELRAASEIRDFDIAPDGSRILFDRLRANSDVVLMDRAPRK